MSKCVWGYIKGKQQIRLRKDKKSSILLNIYDIFYMRGETTKMWLISFIIFFIPFCIFAAVMIHDSRTLWSGVSFFWMLLCLSVSLFLMLSRYSEWLLSYTTLTGILVFLVISAMAGVILFPALLILLFFIEGINIIRHEGIKPSNLLSMLFSILLTGYLVVWPVIGNLGKDVIGTTLYAVISFTAVYVLALMAMYTLSGILNLIHLKKKRKADYIIVLGSGILGTKVPPLLAARIDRGIELLLCNPDARIIMSGGQGPGEDIPESEAMAFYALERGVDIERIMMEQKSVSTEENLRFSRELMVKENPSIIVVTTAYHVFRALILARQQGMKCVGFGAKTKWYFTLNALIREFAGYLRLSWKKHAVVIGIATGILSVGNIVKIAGMILAVIS